MEDHQTEQNNMNRRKAMGTMIGCLCASVLPGTTPVDPVLARRNEILRKVMMDYKRGWRYVACFDGSGKGKWVILDMERLAGGSKPVSTNRG